MRREEKTEQEEERKDRDEKIKRRDTHVMKTVIKREIKYELK